MAKKRKNLPELVPELFEHEQFGQFRFIKRGEEIWFAAVDVCNALGLTNPTMAVNRLKENERAKFNLGQSDINGDEYPKQNLGYSKKRGNPNLTFVNEPGLYRLIFASNKPEAEKFQDWVYHEVLPAIRKYGFYRVQQPEQEKVYVEITGDKYFKLFKEKYPEIDFNKALHILGFAEIYDETGHYHEETVYRLRLNPDEYAKLRRDVLSLQCLEQLAPRKSRHISQTTLQSKKIEA